MTKVYYFSGSGHSRAVAEACAELLHCGTAEIHEKIGEILEEPVTAVIVFPVYCQNIPERVMHFLRGLTAQYVVLIATYGRISHGNVLQEAQKAVKGDVIAGAYIPMGHTFLDGDCTFDAECLRPIVRRITEPERIRIPAGGKNILANLFPGLRSRIGVRIIRNDRCVGCGVCEKQCPMEAIQDGRITAKCIRCLRCVTVCPQGALQYKNTWVLDAYLHRYYNPDAECTICL